MYYLTEEGEEVGVGGGGREERKMEGAGAVERK